MYVRNILIVPTNTFGFQQQSKNKRRSIVYRYAFEMITDVLSIVAYIFLFITRWNYRMMVEETKNMNTFDKNLKLIEFMFITLLDLPAILVSALLLISWRTVNVYKYLGTVRTFYSAWHNLTWRRNSTLASVENSCSMN